MLKKIIKSVVGKIVIGYVMIIAVALISTLVSLYIINKNNKSDKYTTETLFPSVIKLKVADKLCSDSYMLITRWVNQPDDADKKNLENLMDVEFAKFKKDYLSKVAEFENDSSVQLSNDMIKSFESLIESNKKVLQILNSQEVFAEDSIVDLGLQVYDGEVKPKTLLLQKQIAQLTAFQNQHIEDARSEKVGDSNLMINIYIVSIVLFLAIGLIAIRFSRKTVITPIVQLSDLVSNVSKGHLVDMKIDKNDDEIGGMVGHIEEMIHGMKEKAIFAEKIGQGKYDSAFELLSEEDSMGISLVKMRDNLKKSAEDDSKRSWAAEGIAKFSGILRNNNNDSQALFDETISNLVRYVGANQGGLFIVNEENADDVHLELIAFYAYERKKYTERRIEVGEGLIGQCYLEGEYIYMTDVPQNYVHITSGLGEATPTSVLIAPLKVNDQIYGIVEFASFKPFEDYQIDFVIKLGENIASTISSSKINQKTQKLLENSKIQTEELRAQEEEMRQNMEELQATQEEMERKERDYKNRISALEEEVESLRKA